MNRLENEFVKRTEVLEAIRDALAFVRAKANSTPRPEPLELVELFGRSLYGQIDVEGKAAAFERLATGGVHHD